MGVAPKKIADRLGPASFQLDGIQAQHAFARAHNNDYVACVAGRQLHDLARLGLGSGRDR